jgi:hypothetical protein
MTPLQRKRLMGLSRMSDETGYDSFYDRAYWKLKFLWVPKRSYLTNKWLWLRNVYEGTAMWTGPGTPVIEFRYHEPDEHLIWRLKA